MPLSPLFVAVGHRGLRMTSTDGKTWSNAQTGKEGEVYRAVSFGNGRFAAVGTFGGANIYASTADGTTWQTGTRDAKYVSYLRGLGFGQDKFLGLGGDPGSVGDSKPFVMTSADGQTWSDVTPIAGRNMLRRVCYGNERFVAVGDRGRRAASKDGKEWIDTEKVKAIDTLIDVTFGNGLFVGVGLHGLRMSSADGVTWSERLTGEEGEHINSVLWTGERFVAVGQGATYHSTDGLKWDRQPNTNAPLIAVFGEKQFVGSNWRGRLLHSTDAITWTDVFQAEHHVEALAFGHLDVKTP
ncbi:hypothetical protein ETAA8_33440 [Anatilimnocola aggregata]|uniref:Photosynthesis system II assembly factor Ycf48/Hcf136-like domain-containing protein n=1 Tax=Anatilimnocola aggregata TaxID=2528021 RepID=A0A517YDD9_9BACT|nr:hypothetical protein [Anatilimnocola aggregata]QDU28244.1 hypothetical protein ETAA8_33440 [Anatilimnocola aggregata]